MSARTTRIGSIIVLGLIAVCVCGIMGMGIFEVSALAAGGTSAESSSMTVPVALLTGLVILATGAVKLAEVAVQRLRKTVSNGGTQPPRTEQNSRASEREHGKIVELLDKLLDRIAEGDAQQIRSLDKLQSSVCQLDQSVIGLTGRFDNAVTMLAIRGAQQDITKLRE